MARITVVNDNPDFLELMHEILEDERYDATTIDGDRADALDRIRASRPDLLMIDIRLGVDGAHGWDIAKQVRREPEFHGLPLLLCCSDPFAASELEGELEATHDVETLSKPFSIDQLDAAIDRLLGDAAVR
ncbi:MAG TPA: response regulator [Candidatus Limnocylindria bacterium]|jgi:CheY-like chemotaxis protein|nr:response regulator [Candidatus Limnocylindria bacterium]